MSFSIQKSLRTSVRSSWTILKLIVPIYILADILFYYDLLSHITFIFKPIVSLLGLPQEAALSIVSGLFLNLYAAIAFAAPLGTWRQRVDNFGSLFRHCARIIG